MDSPDETFPDLAGREFEIAGIIWFQGWNDMINGGFVAEYKENMVHFIKDLRTHLGKENLPFVIGVSGQGGDAPAGKTKTLRDAQTAPAKMKEFNGNVASVETAPFFDPSTNHGDGGYHYNGSASFFYNAGVAMGEAMLELLPKAEPRPLATEKHTFRSADGKKTFDALLTAYDPATGMVTVQKANRSTITFNIDILSEEDQKYVKEQAE